MLAAIDSDLSVFSSEGNIISLLLFFKRISTVQGLNFLFLCTAVCSITLDFTFERRLYHTELSYDLLLQLQFKYDLRVHGSESRKRCIGASAVPVEGEHAACDGHVHWHLSRHPANHKHLLSRVRMEGRVINVLGSPELILCQAGPYNTSSERKK